GIKSSGGNPPNTDPGSEDGAYSFKPVISSQVSNYNLRSAAVAAGWDGVRPLNAEETISSAGAVTSTSTSTAAFITVSGFPIGSTLPLVNDACIIREGGTGGAGGHWYWAAGVAGGQGGPGLRADAAITVINRGLIAAGGAD